MPHTYMDKHLLVEYLNCRRLPVAQCAEAVHLHSAICEVAPDLYLRLLADSVTDVSHKREMLLNFLSHPAAKEYGRQRILTQLYALPISEALHVVEVIREQRINRSRARELVLAFLLGHEQFPTLAATKKQRVIRLLKHALGERTWSSIRRFLAETSEDGEAFLQRELLHLAWNADRARAREVLSFLAGVTFSPRESILAKSLAARQNIELGEGLPKETLLGLRGVYHTKVPVKKVHYLSAVDSTSARTDGPLTVLYKESFFEQAKSGTPVAAPASPVPEPVRREGPFAILYQAIAQLFKAQASASEPPSNHQGASSDAQALTLHVTEQDLSDRLARTLDSIPLIQGRLALVLDLSASMVSSGERLYHPVALALALTRLLQERVQKVSLHQVSGTPLSEGLWPEPQGPTDVASALLAAAHEQPQAILIISDGYENTRQGDTACVIQGLRQLGMTMPIYQVVPVFTLAENLAQRRFGEAIPVIPLAHEDGVRELLAYMLLASADEQVSAEEIGQLQQILCVR